MVRKIIIFALFSVLIITLSLPCFAYSVYTDGNISSTYLTYFQDILSGLSPLDDYVFFRSGQYDYTLIVGDLTYADSVFSGKDYTAYTISTNSGTSAYSSVYKYTVTSGSNFSLSVGSYLVYSNLGSYPILEDRSSVYGYATLFLLVVIAVCMLVRPILNFTYRFRSGIH